MRLLSNIYLLPKPQHRDLQWPSGLDKLGISPQAVTSVCGFDSHKRQILRTCPNMTLAVEQDLKPNMTLTGAALPTHIIPDVFVNC